MRKAGTRKVIVRGPKYAFHLAGGGREASKIWIAEAGREGSKRACVPAAAESLALFRWDRQCTLPWRREEERRGEEAMRQKKQILRRRQLKILVVVGCMETVLYSGLKAPKRDYHEVCSMQVAVH